MKPLDCQSCGACCVSPFAAQGYIQLTTGDDESLLADLGLPILEIVPADETGESLSLLGTRFNRQGKRVCCALEGRVGQRVSCTVYEARPVLCRQFEAGSPECLQARRAQGL